MILPAWFCLYSPVRSWCHHPFQTSIPHALTWKFPQADFGSIHLLGFSQGAALAYAFTLFYPGRVTTLAGLAGFLPENAENWAQREKLTGLPVFISHGIRDDVVPVADARMAARVFQESGAKVTYCEDDVGHKLGANCFRALQAFYSHPKRGDCIL